jgi:predicted dehydrogenase
VVGDLGSHAFHLGEYVSGCRATALSADLHTFVEGRELEDNAQITLRYEDGVRGALWTSVVAAGENVGLRFRVYGEKGHLAWDQRTPNHLTLAMSGEPPRLLDRGGDAAPATQRASRLFAGLAEGFLEAFANLYTDYADTITARRAGAEPDPLALWSPDVEDGARGVAFVQTVVDSSHDGGAWTDFATLF